MQIYRMSQAVVPSPIRLSTAEPWTVVLEAVNQAPHRAEVVQQMLRAVAVLHKLHKPQVAVVAVKNLRTDDRSERAYHKGLRHEEIIADIVWSFTVPIRGFHGNVFLWRQIRNQQDPSRGTQENRRHGLDWRRMDPPWRNIAYVRSSSCAGSSNTRAI
jgi:hypothetical protein